MHSFAWLDRHCTDVYQPCTNQILLGKHSCIPHLGLAIVINMRTSLGFYIKELLLMVGTYSHPRGGLSLTSSGGARLLVYEAPLPASCTMEVRSCCMAAAAAFG